MIRGRVSAKGSSEALAGSIVLLPDSARASLNATLADDKGAFTLTAYAAVQILADSINAVGVDPAKVADHMHKATFNTAIGKDEYDAKGDLKEFEFAVFKWDKKGDLEQLKL